MGTDNVVFLEVIEWFDDSGEELVRRIPRNGSGEIKYGAQLKEELAMIIMHVFIQVKPEKIEAFKAATIENARNSVKEPGIARFDVIQQIDDPTRFVLIEVYRTAEDPAKHKQTAHYHKWLEVAEDMIATPRTRAFYNNVFPDDAGW